MNIQTIMWLFLSFAATPAVAELTHSYSRELEIADADRQNLIAVPLDAAVYQSTDADFRDLRLTDKDGVETPYLLQKTASQKRLTRRIRCSAHEPSLQPSGGDGIEITVEMDREAAEADGLSVLTNQHDFEYLLQVQGSYDGQQWQPLVDNALIYDYARFMNVANLDVPLPYNRFRYFKIVVKEAVQSRAAELMELTRTLRGPLEMQRQERFDLRREPLHIEGIELWHNQVETVADDEQLFDYPVSGFSVSQDAERKTTLLDIETANQPLTGLSLDIATPLFSRRAEVQIPLQEELETRMQTITTGALNGLRFQDIDHAETRLVFPEQRRPNYRVVIYNQDSPPLEISQVKGIGPGYQLLFVNKPGNRYQLRYGAGKAPLPAYDVAAIQELLRQGYTPTVTGLGPEKAATRIEPGWTLADWLNSKLFLGGVIGLMVLVLGWSLYKVGKRVSGITD